MYNLVTVLGHTAGGKTRFAARLAGRIGGEIISADSRQVYRRMDLGTGKDYRDYEAEEGVIPCHLVDILEPGGEYNVYLYQKDFLRVFREIGERNKIPVLCGGSGLYIEAVLKGYRLIQVPLNRPLRARLQGKSMDELRGIFTSFRKPHNITDTGDRKRLIRAIEIETYYREHPHLDEDYPELKPLIIGIGFDRETRRKRISQRLNERIKSGMIKEVESLLKEGIPPEKLIYYGLEYRYITEYLLGYFSLEEMMAKLETAIHRFAKRQTTWFRRMERSGMNIHWMDGQMPIEEKLEVAMALWFKNPSLPGSS